MVMRDTAAPTLAPDARPRVAAAPPLRPDDAAVERLLEALQWSVLSIDRTTLPDGGTLPLEAGPAGLVYVLAGEARLPSRRGCDVEATADARLRFRGATTASVLPVGDALFSMGRAALRLRARGETTMVVVRLRPAEGAEHLLSAIPDAVSVRDFAALEPGAAAMAAHLGGALAGACDGPGASVVCRLMATTLVIATLRAWATTGCVPDDWPARTQDPFLARAVDAIHADPGADWSVERLASLAAMSRSVFAARFRAVFGSAPAEYVATVRMDVAKVMLAESGTSVSDVARRLGYGSDEGFSRAFRRHTGTTPSAWRATGRRRATPVERQLASRVRAAIPKTAAPTATTITPVR